MKRSLTEHGLAFAGPWLVGFVLLSLIPMIGSAALSLTRWDGLSDDGTAVSPGVYHVVLVTDDGRFSRKAVRIR